MRFILRNRVSFPYLSGDAFRKISDFYYKPSNDRKSNQTEIFSKAFSVFVDANNLKEFCARFKQVPGKKLILVGNSDLEFHSNEILNINPDWRYLLQNSFISDNKFIWTMPIGIENLRLARNGLPKYLEPKLLKERNNKVMIGPFSKTHYSRLKILEAFAKVSGPWDLFDGYVPPNEYFKKSNCYKFILVPRGNGIDTHRLWETLYRGAIPILKADEWSVSLKYLNLPILYTKNWEPSTIKNILETYEPKDFAPKDLPALWIKYWQDFIESLREI